MLRPQLQDGIVVRTVRLSPQVAQLAALLRLHLPDSHVFLTVKLARLRARESGLRGGG
jgi:hypothetical protein